VANDYRFCVIRFEVGIFCFIVSFIFEKKIRLEVYCSVFLVASITLFATDWRIVYIGDSLGHMICL
jgi:hypothetical protein